MSHKSLFLFYCKTFLLFMFKPRLPEGMIIQVKKTHFLIYPSVHTNTGEWESISLVACVGVLTLCKHAFSHRWFTSTSSVFSSGDVGNIWCNEVILHSFPMLGWDDWKSFFIFLLKVSSNCQISIKQNIWPRGKMYLDFNYCKTTYVSLDDLWWDAVLLSHIWASVVFEVLSFSSHSVWRRHPQDQRTKLSTT